ncbi:MAG: clostripain-related cysteine peptidase [Chloroflexota bacterium]|nr:clostripain-related cysteine peptidase [Chloroflexota bacterium]
MKQLGWLSLITILFILPGVGLAQENANWTILHYTAVDNDLEGAAFNDYYEMQTTGSGDGVNIVAQLDRAEGYDGRFGDWTDTRRFFIEQSPALPVPDIDGKRAALLTFFVEQGLDADQVNAELATFDDATIEAIYTNNNVGVTFEQTAVETLGEVDMGDPQALTDFIVWGVENYPASHYMIVIGSHGAGWRGLGPDYGNSQSMLTLPEIDSALGAARAQLGIERFDIVGFDACLMGVTDVAVMLEPHASYVLFAQEVIPGNGWEYRESIDAMKANPDWDAFQVGAAFIDSYMAYYAGEGARTKVDLALVDTAGVPALLASLEQFAQVVAVDTVELLSALGTARNNSQAFGASLGDRADFYSYIDLRDFMTWFSLQTTITEEAYLAAQEVIAAYDRTVAYSQSDSRLPGANGLGIYLPSTQPIYEAFGIEYSTQSPSSMTFWQDYLLRFYETIATELDGSALQLQITDVFTLGERGSSLDTPVIFFDAGGKGVVDLSYTILYLQQDGTQVIVDNSPISYTSLLPTGETVVEYPNELTPSTFTWSVALPYVSDGSGSALGLPQSSSASGGEMSIAGTFVNAQGSQPAYLIFDTATYTYQGMLAIADNAPYEARPLPGDQFIVDLFIITPEGEVQSLPQSDRPLTFGLTPFTINFQPAFSGDYRVQLAMSDLAGNRIVQRTEVVIDNEGVDDSLRGFTDTNEGVYFQYPFAWGESVLISNDDGSLTQLLGDIEGTQSLAVTALYDTEAETALLELVETIADEAGEIVETTLGGLPAYRMEYSATTDTGAIVGIAYSLFQPESGAVLVFTIESSGDGEVNATLESLLDATLGLFAPL